LPNIVTAMKCRSFLLGISLTAGIFAYQAVPSRASTSQFYFSLNCLSQIEDQDSCNATFLNKSINVRFTNGRTTRVRYDAIKSWSFLEKRSSRLNEEMVIGFGPAGLVVGTLFRRAQHQFIFAINYDSGFGDNEVLFLNFSDKKYIEPVMAQLRENAPNAEIKRLIN
jgi:hypothetical protein